MKPTIKSRLEVDSLAENRKLTVQSSNEPQVAFVMPAYGHPVLMTEAIDCALNQVAKIDYKIVVISDGCTMAETDTVCRSYAITNPNLIYLRKPNGGPGSARNRGIDFALESWPSLSAIFFLDADNRLPPSALQDAWDAMMASPDAGWVYTNIDSFGISWTGKYDIPYSPLLHIAYENICDTGSLVRRAVFDAGVRFDEDSRAGFEDWDFFLQALEKGFLGQPASFGLAYRQRPESRFRATNRNRPATLDYLRSRHRDLSSAAKLIEFEHTTNPRFMMRVVDRDANFDFTDPAHPHGDYDDKKMAANFWAAVAEPDSHAMAPFWVWGSTTICVDLSDLKVLQNVFWLMERSCAETTFAALTLEICAEEIGVATRKLPDLAAVADTSVLLMTANAEIKRMSDLPHNLDSNVSGSVTEIILRAPKFNTSSHLPSLPALRDTMRAIWDHPCARLKGIPKRWTWRPQRFPARDTYGALMRTYLESQATMPRLTSVGALDIGVVVPIASFGGAEKVAYAMARNLRQYGARMHLYIVGEATFKVIPEFDQSFDTMSFLADPEFPFWGGKTVSFGQQFHLPESAELKTPRIIGLLAGLDVIINCHSAPINSIMGALRRQGARTATYLHLTDTSAMGMLVGHTYLTVAFEHAYDKVITCSEHLADEMHMLGVPRDKLIPIRNAAGLSLPAAAREDALRIRRRGRGKRKLRVLYLGRLDRQKGIDRLYAVARDAKAQGLPIELRIVGGSLVERHGGQRAENFSEFDVCIEPPVYKSDDLAEHYSWADVLLLPSRWEGAPLVIPECQSLGCIPIATNVGAITELLDDGVDGILVPSGDDDQTVSAMLDALRQLIDHDKMRISMAGAGIQRSSMQSWDRNFGPLRSWLFDSL